MDVGSLSGVGDDELGGSYMIYRGEDKGLSRSSSLTSNGVEWMKGSGCLSSVCGKGISSRHFTFVIVMKEGKNTAVMETCFVFVSSVDHN